MAQQVAEKSAAGGNDSCSGRQISSESMQMSQQKCITTADDSAKSADGSAGEAQRFQQSL